jgi:FAD-dependent urate hydroxylase
MTELRSAGPSFTEETVVIGAGPHGLAASAHLRHAGVSALCLGKPLEFWREHMPTGMMLRSRDRSSNISDPNRKLTIEHYVRACGRRIHRPNLGLEDFVDYGLWFQEQAVPDLDQRTVTRVSRAADQFELQLSDGDIIRAARVVVAAGLSPFPHRPAVFAELGDELATHTCDHVDLAQFSGSRVAIVGAGQSALESAALLSELGADVEVLARAPGIRWLSDAAHDDPSRWNAPTDVGGFLTGWLAAVPDVFRRLPSRQQPRLAHRAIGPAGSGWLRPRLTAAVLSCGRSVLTAAVRNDGVCLHLNDGTTRNVDHVLMATGYRVDVSRYDFLDPGLTADLAIAHGYPVLGKGMESSVPGLHFVGAPAAHSFGPIMRFVVGTAYSAPTVASGIAGHRQRPIRFAF